MKPSSSETPMKLNKEIKAATEQQATLAVREQVVIVQGRVILGSLVTNSAASVRWDPSPFVKSAGSQRLITWSREDTAAKCSCASDPM